MQNLLTVCCLALLGTSLLTGELIAQDWQATGEMQQPRFRHRAILLDDGRVLLAGGTTTHVGPSLSACELFDYRDNSVTPTGDLNDARQAMEMIKLSDGRVLVVGGASAKSANHRGQSINSAEIYDPATGLWTRTTPMQTRRESCRLAQLPDGRILAVGGIGGGQDPSQWDILQSCEVFDPQTETWSPAPAMNGTRVAFSLNVLSDGRLFVSGGYGSGQRETEIFDPQTETWSPAAAFLEGGTGQHSSTVISAGRILRTGGWPGPQAWSEIYDPASDSWRTTLAALAQSRFAHEAIQQPDGKILVAGGLNSRKTALTSCELFDPATESWSAADDLAFPNTNFSMIALPNQQVLISGGSQLQDDNVIRVHSELYVSKYVTEFNSAPISGRLWRDYDDDCSPDGPQDKGAGLNLLEFNPGGFLTMTDPDGCFETRLQPGNYSVKAVNLQSWEQHCPAGELSFNVPGSLEPVENLDMGTRPLSAYADLNVSLAGTRARPGFELRYVLRYQNVGSAAFSGELLFQFPPLLNVLSSSLPADLTESGLLAWNLIGVAADEVGEIEVLFRVPADQSLIGRELCATLMADSDKRDDLLLRERESYCVEVTGSYDPNDLAVFPKGNGALGALSLDVTELAYLVRFQNTGNDTAFTVRLVDTLDAAHQVSGLRLGASSHPYKLNILDGGILEFTFGDIKLPHQAQEELASQGYVKFYVPRIAELANKTTLDNQVAIYFDFNEPIFTNTVYTTFDNSVTDVPGEVLSQLDVELYPNPAIEKATVVFEEAGRLAVLELRDVVGRAIVRKNIKRDSLSEDLDLAALPAGSYQLLALDKRGTARAQRRLIVQR